jgi:transcriptional regulator with XRE-family HTH domain
MDDIKVGALVRAIRHRRGWTQRQLGARIDLSQQLISLFERGHLDDLTVRTARRVASALEVSLAFEPRWRGGEAARLLDADHAAMVNRLVALLRAAGWETAVEFTFNHFGERGSMDLIGWHAASRCLLLVEVKSRLLDTQATLATLDRKVRVVPMLLARERGWAGTTVGVVLAMAGSTANRSAVERHAATFASAFPDRAVAVRSWLRRPQGRLAAVWFLANTSRGSGTQPSATRRRVRAVAPRSHRRDEVP